MWRTERSLGEVARRQIPRHRMGTDCRVHVVIRLYTIKYARNKYIPVKTKEKRVALPLAGAGGRSTCTSNVRVQSSEYG